MRQCHPTLPALLDPFASICLAESTCSGPVSFYELEFARPGEVIRNANSFLLAALSQQHLPGVMPSEEKLLQLTRACLRAAYRGPDGSKQKVVKVGSLE